METPEILLADRLNQKGRGDRSRSGPSSRGQGVRELLRGHEDAGGHPHRFGVPINVAESQLSGRIKEVERSLLPVNHTRPVDAARLFDLPLVCLHTPADNMVAGYLQALFDRESPSRLKDVIRLLKAIPEYQESTRNNAGPRILIGSDEQRTGKIFVMTGGTSGSRETIEKLCSWAWEPSSECTCPKSTGKKKKRKNTTCMW